MNRGVVRLTISSLASVATVFGSKSIDLTQIKGVRRGTVIKTIFDREKPQ